jgi:DNA uptake protein ComE-like DNA-binding protein
VTISPKPEEDKPVLTTRDLRLLYVVALIALLGLAMLSARRLGYWPGPKVTVTAVASRSEPLDLNRAQWWELDSLLPGIGEVRAKAIINARPPQGFRSVDDLDAVPGIPRQVLKQLKPLVQVNAPKEVNRD